MPKSCCVAFCASNKLKNPELKFYILPSQETEPSRRTQWLQAIGRQDEFGRLWNPTSKHVYVCSQHFITGLKREDITHPDYTPSLFPTRRTYSSATPKLKRLDRMSKREHALGKNKGKQQEGKPARKWLKDNADDSETSDDEHNHCAVCMDLFANSKPKEVWVKCVLCILWSHQACTSGLPIYTCHHCECA